MVVGGSLALRVAEEARMAHRPSMIAAGVRAESERAAQNTSGAPCIVGSSVYHSLHPANILISIHVHIIPVHIGSDTLAVDTHSYSSRGQSSNCVYATPRITYTSTEL